MQGRKQNQSMQAGIYRLEKKDTPHTSINRFQILGFPGFSAYFALPFSLFQLRPWDHVGLFKTSMVNSQTSLQLRLIKMQKSSHLTNNLIKRRPHFFLLDAWKSTFGNPISQRLHISEVSMGIPKEKRH